MDLIYQYWDGEIKAPILASSESFKKYADRIGVEHIFEDNPQFFKSYVDEETYVLADKWAPHYGALKIIFDESFDKYDNIAFIDSDIFPVDGLTENIFDTFHGEIGIVPESFTDREPWSRDNYRWKHWIDHCQWVYGTIIPFKNNGNPRILNSGVVLYSKEARLMARRKWSSIENYVSFISARQNGVLNDFFLCDQAYIHFNIYRFNFNVQFISEDWNSQVMSYFTGWDKNDLNFHIDQDKKPDTKFVHIRLTDHNDLLTVEDHYNITNKPIEEWGAHILDGSYGKGVFL